jgi:hypothetical protein
LPGGLERIDPVCLPADDILSRRQFCGHRMSRLVLLCQHGHEHADALYAGLVLCRRWSVGADWKLLGRLLLCGGLEHGDATSVRFGPLLSGRVDVGDAIALSRWLVLPGAERDCDAVSRIALLSVERPERADRVRRGFVLQCGGPERRDGPVQRRLLLWRRLVDGDSAFVRLGFILSDWKHDRHNLSTWRLLPRALAVQQCAEPNRFILQHDGPLFVCAVHAGRILCNGRA